MKQDKRKDTPPEEKDISNNTQGDTDKEITDNSTTIDLPDVKDIPGQEHVHPPTLGALADNTISSADEEDVLNGDTLDEEANNDTRIVMGTSADVTKGDLQNLQGFDPDDERVDDTDAEGAPLQEDTDTVLTPGEDLDVPGSEYDDANEDIGEEDEENNYYSLGSGDNDNLEQPED